MTCLRPPGRLGQWLVGRGVTGVQNRGVAPPPPLGEGKIGLRGGGGVVGVPEGRGGGFWQWGSCDRTLGKVPITSSRGC